MDKMEKYKRPRYLVPVVSIVLGLFLAVTGLVQAGAGSWLLEKVANRAGDRLAEEIVNQNPDLVFQGGDDEVAAGSTGESLAIRNLTGLFDLTLKDGDGTDSGQSASKQLLTGDLYESAGSGQASSTLASVRNTTGQRNLFCPPDITLSLFASSTKAINRFMTYHVATSSVSGRAAGATSTVTPLLAITLNAGDLTQAGRVITASSTGNNRAGGSGDCVVWEPNDYILLFANGGDAADSATSSDYTGVASSSFYTFTPRQMTTSS